MSTKYDAVALGELLIDFTETGVSDQGNPVMEANPGGAPGNVLSMLNHYGHRTAFIGKVGDDMFGRQILRALTEVGIGTKGILTDPDVRTTLAFVHTLPDGDREFSFYRNPGADMMLRPEEVSMDLVQNCRIFHFGTLSMTHSGCREATKKAVLAAKEAGAVISFDPNLRMMLWKDPEETREQVLWGIRHCDILKISDNEVTWLTGEEDYDRGYEWIRRQADVPLVLISMGREGSRAYMDDARAEVPALLSPRTIETTGAGDTFGGSVLHYVLTHGMRKFSEDELTGMLRLANAAASIVTTRKGALRSMPDVEEIREVMKMAGWMPENDGK